MDTNIDLIAIIYCCCYYLLLLLLNRFLIVVQYQFRGDGFERRYLLPKMWYAFHAKRSTIGRRFSAMSDSPRQPFCISLHRFSQRDIRLTLLFPALSRMDDRYWSLLFPIYLLIEIYITGFAEIAKKKKSCCSRTCFSSHKSFPSLQLATFAPSSILEAMQIRFQESR